MRIRLVILAVTLGLAVVVITSRAEDSLGTLIDHGRLRQAASVAQARLATKPDDAEALRVLATVRATERRFDEAMKLAEKAIAAAPRDPDAHFALAQVCGMEAPRASTLRKPGLASRFKKEAEATLALDPDHDAATAAMIEYYRVAPGFLGGDKKKAAALADHLVQIHPTSGWLEKADLAASDKDTAQVEACFRKAVEVGHEPRAKVALAGWLATPWRKPDEAERLAQEAVEAEPWRVSAWAVIAGCQALQKRWTDLDATLAAAEGAVPGNLGPHYQAARAILAVKTEPTRAEALLRRYLTVEPEIGQPSHAGAHWRLGQALEQEGKKPEAIAEIQIALKLDDSLEGAKKDLKRLKG
jgi:tetratricopeptide (TPR) repeat protein